MINMVNDAQKLMTPHMIANATVDVLNSIPMVININIMSKNKDKTTTYNALTAELLNRMNGKSRNVTSSLTTNVDNNNHCPSK